MMKRLLALVLVAAALPACGGGGGGGGAVAIYVQVERLARPAIVEGLFLTHDFQTALNGLRPSEESAALTGAVSAEATAVLDALDLVDASEDITAAEAIAAFIPDVMRIDTTGPSGYANALNTAGSPVRGRMILDDVVDITYSYLITGLGGAISDGVPYYRPSAGPGSTNVAIGHKNLNGQVTPGGTATFPFLAPPN
jgi:hypothetical protein